MNHNIEDRIRQAVIEGKEARSAYYLAIELLDQQQLGLPSNSTLLSELETQLGYHLPPSYRIFLTLFDGWRMVDGAMDLLSIEEMSEGPRKESIIKWKRKAKESGDIVAFRSLVIGLSEITPTKLLLDPEVVDEDGEWRIVQHHKDEECEYPSFLIWLEESVHEFRELQRLENEENINSTS